MRLRLCAETEANSSVARARGAGMQVPHAWPVPTFWRDDGFASLGARRILAGERRGTPARARAHALYGRSGSPAAGRLREFFGCANRRGRGRDDLAIDFSFSVRVSGSGLSVNCKKDASLISARGFTVSALGLTCSWGHLSESFCASPSSSIAGQRLQLGISMRSNSAFTATNAHPRYS